MERTSGRTRTERAGAEGTSGGGRARDHLGTEGAARGHCENCVDTAPQRKVLWVS